jgi:glucose-1-phosphate cytidylyltransferase
MEYYSDYGHNDFVLCLGYQANVIKDFFLNFRPQTFGDCVVSDGGRRIQVLGEINADWRITMIDTGIWRNIGERLWAVREHVRDEPMFLANYSDGLTDADLDNMTEFFEQSGKVACFLAVRPPLTYHLAEIGDHGHVLFRPEIFDYMRPGEELVLAPFNRLIAENKLAAYKHEGFWRSMDTLRDWQTLEDMVEKGSTPWKIREPRGADETSVSAMVIQ